MLYEIPYIILCKLDLDSSATVITMSTAEQVEEEIPRSQVDDLVVDLAVDNNNDDEEEQDENNKGEEEE